VNYLLDINVLLEFLLDHDSADEVERFLKEAPHQQLAVTEFIIHSVGISFLRRKLHAGFVRFAEDPPLSGAIGPVRLDVNDNDIVRWARPPEQPGWTSMTPTST
jgi:hypothetical protein